MSFRLRVPEAGAAWIAAMAWLPVAIFAIYSKHIRIDQKYFALIHATSGSGVAPSLFDRLGLYRPELLIHLILVPLAILVTLAIFGRRRYIWHAWVALAALAVVLLYVNLHSWGTIGRFLTYTAAVDAVSFAMVNPEFVSSYIDADSWVKLAVLMSATTGVLFLAERLAAYKLIVKLAKVGQLAIVAFALTAAAFSAASSIKSTPIQGDFLVQAIRALLERAPSGQPGPPPPAEKLGAEFSALTRTPFDLPEGEYFGAASGSDLIVFVLETGSTQFVDLVHDLDAFPTLKELSAHSVIGGKHYSVFPATSEALFSLYASVYPPRSYYSSCVVDASRVGPLAGFVSALASAGYETAAYFPFNFHVPLDRALYSNLGFKKLYFAQAQPPVAGKSRDRQALDEMKGDLRRWLESNERFAAVFLPQIGHAPWSDRPSSRSVREHGKLVVQEQDRWMSEIVDLLRSFNRLEKTTILVVGDHGIRTTIEDPEFVPGMIDTYSFQVPLLLYSTKAFRAPMVLHHRTSHLDVSPSLTHLFGVPLDQGAHQGMLLWDKRASERSLFFNAGWYFGADGFSDGSMYAMFNETLDIAFAGRSLSFNRADAVRSESEKAAIKDRISRLYDLQEQWVERFLCRSK